MSKLLQIRNQTVSGITFNVNDFHSVRLLPGINLLTEADYRFVVLHPIFKHYQELDQLTVDETDLSELKLDDELNLKVVEEYGDSIPVFQVDSANNVMIPGDNPNRTFRAADYRKAGIGQELAKQIHLSTPKVGWSSADQVINAVSDRFNQVLSENAKVEISALFKD